jgi:hypothetical protein
MAWHGDNAIRTRVQPGAPNTQDEEGNAMQQVQVNQPPGWAVREAEDELGREAEWEDIHRRAWELVEADQA